MAGRPACGQAAPPRRPAAGDARCSTIRLTRTPAPFLWERWKRNYVDLGIKTFWLDPCDDLSQIADYDKVHYHAGPGVEANCFYPVAHQKTVFDGLHAAGESEVVTHLPQLVGRLAALRRLAGGARHRLPRSAHLREYLVAGLNLAMAGIPWGAAEIGGFVTPAGAGRRVPGAGGALVPVRGVHADLPHPRPPRQQRAVEHRGGDTYRHIRAALMLRERLRPYVLAQMKVAAERGNPPMRPLFFDFPDDECAAEVEDQFLFGPDLLVAPITEYRGPRPPRLPARGHGVDRRLERRPRARGRRHHRRVRADRAHPGLHPRPQQRLARAVPGRVRVVAGRRSASRVIGSGSSVPGARR